MIMTQPTFTTGFPSASFGSGDLQAGDFQVRDLGDGATSLRPAAAPASVPDEDRGCAARGTLIGLLVVVPFWVVVALLV